MDFATILQLSFLGFTLAAPLGPVNAEMIKQTLAFRGGWKYGIITGSGAMTGDFLIAMTVLFLGAEVFASVLDNLTIKVALLIANVFILGYIGIMSLRTEIKEVELEETVSRSLFKQIRLGFFLVITSPWSYAWWSSFGPVMLNSGIPLETLVERLQATVFFISGIAFWVISFNLALKISHQFASPKVLKGITSGSALVLLGFATKIIFDIVCLLSSWCPLGIPG